MVVFRRGNEKDGVQRKVDQSYYEMYYYNPLFGGGQWVASRGYTTYKGNKIRGSSFPLSLSNLCRGVEFEVTTCREKRLAKRRSNFGEWAEINLPIFCRWQSALLQGQSKGTALSMWHSWNLWKGLGPKTQQRQNDNFFQPPHELRSQGVVHAGVRNSWISEIWYISGVIGSCG